MEATTESPPERLALPEVSRVRTAALWATRAHPGPVGQLIARELRAYADFGYRFGTDGLIERLVTELLALPDAPRPGDHRPHLVLRRPAA